MNNVLRATALTLLVAILPAKAADYVWVGPASGGLWEDFTNWNPRGIPPSDATVLVSDAAPIIGFGVAFAGRLTLDRAGLVNLAAFSNSGVIEQVGGATRAIENYGEFTNTGLLACDPSSAGIVNVFTVVNRGLPGTGMFGCSIQNRVGATFTNQANLSIHAGNVVDNAGSFTNSASLELGGTFTSRTGSVTNNTGGLIVEDGALLATEFGAIFVNAATGRISLGALSNSGAFQNEGRIVTSFIANDGTLCGGGSIVNPTPIPLLVVPNSPLASCLPIADAGDDQTTSSNALVTLDGAAGPAGMLLTYQWSQVAGPSIVLNGSTSARPTFTAPSLSSNQVVTLRLVVNGYFGVSAPDFVDIAIKRLNHPPVADYGHDTTAKPGRIFTLDGSHSSDPDGDVITQYQWTQVGGPPVVLVPNANVVSPTFVVPNAVGSVLLFKLHVFDGEYWSETSLGSSASLADPVAITIVPNSPPVAIAGPSVLLAEGTTWTLGGDHSFDPDAGDAISFRWRQISGPPVTLLNADTPTPSFRAPFVSSSKDTTLVFELVVTDNDPVNPLSSTPDTAIAGIQNINSPPRCDLASPSLSSLWPTDGRFASVTINGIIDDGVSGSPITTRITSVLQDEPVTGLAGGPPDSSPDAIIVPGASADSVQLRRERSARGNGRVYTINFTSSDGWESCNGLLKVSVPLARNGAAVDDGPVYDSTLP